MLTWDLFPTNVEELSLDAMNVLVNPLHSSFDQFGVLFDLSCV